MYECMYALALCNLRPPEGLTQLPSIYADLDVGGDEGHRGCEREGRHEQHRVAELDHQTVETCMYVCMYA